MDSDATRLNIPQASRPVSWHPAQYLVGRGRMDQEPQQELRAADSRDQKTEWQREPDYEQLQETNEKVN